MSEGKSEIDAMYQLVTFASEAEVVTTDGWLEGEYLLEELPNDDDAEGATNYQDALVKAQQAASVAKSEERANAKTVVLFLTDGVPEGCLVSPSTYPYNDYDVMFRFVTKSSNAYDYYYQLDNNGSWTTVAYTREQGTNDWYGWCGGVGSGKGITGLYYSKIGLNPKYAWGTVYDWEDKDGKWQTSHCDQMYYQGALMGADTLQCDAFYAVGFGSELHNIDSNSETSARIPANLDPREPMTVLEGVADAVHAQDKSAHVIPNDGLAAFFEQFAAAITHLSVYDVDITDTLSDYAQVTGNDAKLTVAIKDSSGNTLQEQTGTVSDPPKLTPEDGVHSDMEEYNDTIYTNYDGAEKRLNLGFPDNYDLHEGWVYSVTIQIEPTQLAYEHYSQEGYNINGSPILGDNDTDVPGMPQALWTSSGLPGFYSNNEATLTYLKTGHDERFEEPYPMPVLQVALINLTVQKTKQDGSALPGAEFALYKKDSDGSTNLYYSFNQENNKVSWGKDIQPLPTAENDSSQFLVQGLPPGTYYLKETKAPKDYTKLEDPIEIQVDRGQIISAQRQGDTTTDLSFTQSADNPLDYTVYVPNYAVYKLPATGGKGTAGFLLGGAGLVGLSAWNRRRQNQNNNQE